MKNPHIAYLLYVCRNARALDKERPFYGAMLRESQMRLVRIRKVNKLRAHIAKTNYSSIEARALSLMGGIDYVPPCPRKEPVQPINWNVSTTLREYFNLGIVPVESLRNSETVLRDYQVPAIEDALSSITPHKFLAAMAECGKSPTGRVPQMVGRVTRFPKLTVSPEVFKTDVQAFSKAMDEHRKNALKQTQEDYAKSEISRLTGFLFEPGELQSMNADELLRIFNAGVNLGRML